MAKYILTNRAVGDLSAIWEYTCEAWSESQADNYYELLIESCEEIAKSPDMGKKYDGIGSAIFGFRVGRHIIFYRKEKSKEIEVLRILHERMDLKHRLDE